MSLKGRVLRTILITVFAGGVLLLLLWWDKKHPLAIHVIRNGEKIAAADKCAA